MSITVDDKEQVRLMQSRFEVESLSYAQIEKLDDNVLASENLGWVSGQLLLRYP